MPILVVPVETGDAVVDVDDEAAGLEIGEVDVVDVAWRAAAALLGRPEKLGVGIQGDAGLAIRSGEFPSLGEGAVDEVDAAGLRGRPGFEGVGCGGVEAGLFEDFSNASAGVVADDDGCLLG